MVLSWTSEKVNFCYNLMVRCPQCKVISLIIQHITAISQQSVSIGKSCENWRSLNCRHFPFPVRLEEHEGRGQFMETGGDVLSSLVLRPTNISKKKEPQFMKGKGEGKIRLWKRSSPICGCLSPMVGKYCFWNTKLKIRFLTPGHYKLLQWSDCRKGTGSCFPLYELLGEKVPKVANILSRSLFKPDCRVSGRERLASFLISRCCPSSLSCHP